jgi:hypothetical protein
MCAIVCLVVDEIPDTDEARDVRQSAKAIDELAFKLLSEGKWQAMLAAAQARDEQSTLYTLNESFKPDPEIDLEATLGLIRVTREQIRSRSSILDDPGKPPGHSLVWDEWTKSTKESLKYFENRLSALGNRRSRGKGLSKRPKRMTIKALPHLGQRDNSAACATIS